MKNTIQESPDRFDEPSLSKGNETKSEMSFVETLDVCSRGLFMIRHFSGRFASKQVLNYISLAVPVTLLPWPIKILIDHVVLATPIADATGYPPVMLPLLDYLSGSSPPEILAVIVTIWIVTVLLVGGYAPGDNARDETEAYLAQGHDIATRVENRLHSAHSYVGGLYGYIEFRIHMRLTQAANHFIRSKLFRHIKSLPMSVLNERRIGDSVYRVMYDTPAITSMCYDIAARTFMSTAVLFVGLATFISAYPNNPDLVWLAVLVYPVFLLLSVPFANATRKRGQASRVAGATTTSTVEEGMDNILAVQSLGGNQNEKSRFGTDSEESFKKFRGVIWIGTVVGQFIGGSYTVIVAMVIFYTSAQIIEGTMTPGDYGALLYYFKWLRGPTRAMGLTWIELQSHAAGIHRVFSVLDLPSEREMGNVQLPSVEHGVSFEGAGLVYPDGRRALSEVSFKADVGQIVAIVGPTGAGKTTLASLIPRYLVATEGRVLVDGHDVRDVSLESLRRQVTYVFQETKLMSDSIADNIRFGNPGAGFSEVERVARIAGAHEFIDQLPDGYDTKLGTTSSKISVGQKQRIAIARGLLRESRVLILDEPTSALDPETESYLVGALHEAARDQLVVVIAHRLSTIAQADNIVFLEDGRFLESGSHADLMAIEDGNYRRFVELQTRTVGNS
jgi:subfamily B ATP-binding cassette protein MsbA